MPSREECSEMDLSIKQMHHDFHNHLRELREDIKRGQEQDAASINKLVESTEGLIEAWNTANGVGKFLKWASGIVGVIAIGWGYFHK